MSPMLIVPLKEVSLEAVALVEVNGALDVEVPNTPILSSASHCITRWPSDAIPPTVVREDAPACPSVVAVIATSCPVPSAENVCSSEQPDTTVMATKPANSLLRFILNCSVISFASSSYGSLSASLRENRKSLELAKLALIYLMIEPPLPKAES